MRRLDSPELRIDIERLAQQAFEKERMINVPVIAEQVRRKHEHLNIAREDIEGLVMNWATVAAYPMKFEGVHATVAASDAVSAETQEASSS